MPEPYHTGYSSVWRTFPACVRCVCLNHKLARCTHPEEVLRGQVTCDPLARPAPDAAVNQDVVARVDVLMTMVMLKLTATIVCVENVANDLMTTLIKFPVASRSILCAWWLFMVMIMVMMGADHICD